jgi:ubiquinol-cytochrome c reductase cytochrome b subunit
MLLAILILFILPIIDFAKIKTPRIRFLHNIFFSLFIFNFLFLGFLGGSPAEDPFIFLSRVASVFYFSHFIFFIPMLCFIENKINLIYFSKYNENLYPKVLHEYKYYYNGRFYI